MYRTALASCLGVTESTRCGNNTCEYGIDDEHADCKNFDAKHQDEFILNNNNVNDLTHMLILTEEWST